ncbi:MAG: hypothetical protein ACYST9_05370, partial [Planctomycetota bacterium]
MKRGIVLLFFLIAWPYPAATLAESHQITSPPESTTRHMKKMPGNAHEFYFTRGIYSGEYDDYDEGGRWAVDYPKADH